ncbi:MAG: hypothetical protein K6C33_11955 [Desulfovibrio sp.]|nr:hypothetical protein [Desulfovibrio sp.]MBQ2516614.1 hypothetical protein [Desulfovibrio sp.]MCR5171157.1 hypothetical protein [Desulfovibrio sp.]
MPKPKNGVVHWLPAQVLRQEPESGEYPPSRSVEDVLANKDGVLSENLLEFKLSVSE